MSKYGVFSGPYFLHLDWIRRDTEYLTVFSPNAGKYSPEKASYLDTFHTVIKTSYWWFRKWTQKWLMESLSYDQTAIFFGVVVIITAQLHSTKPELRFCAGSNPVHGLSEIRDGEGLWQWSRLEIRVNAFRRSTIRQKQFSSYLFLYSGP